MLRVQIDPRGALATLSDLEQRQAPFAVSLFLNRLGNDAQGDMRDQIKRAFKLRREDWNLKGIYIARQDRATKTSWRVVIQVEDKRSYLNKFEDGGEKVPLGGRMHIAVPNDDVFRGRILKPDDPLRPKNLQLHRDSHGRVIGDQRTFVLPLRHQGEQGIFQRLGKDKRGRQKKNKGIRGRKGLDSGIQLLYTLVKRVPVRAQLQFVPTITATVATRSASRFREAFDEAMRTAR